MQPETGLRPGDHGLRPVRCPLYTCNNRSGNLSNRLATRYHIITHCFQPAANTLAGCTAMAGNALYAIYGGICPAHCAAANPTRYIFCSFHDLFRLHSFSGHHDGGEGAGGGRANSRDYA